MYFVSITRLRLRSFIYLPAFFRASEAALKQLLQTPGFIAGKELPDRKLTFWTLTVWKADADMKVFRNSEAHRKAMQKLPDWCSEATYAHWIQEDSMLPDWQTVYNRMIEEGKITKVLKPTPDHLTRNFAAPKWMKAERVFSGVATTEL